MCGAVVQPCQLLIAHSRRAILVAPTHLQGARQGGWQPIAGVRYRKHRWTVTPRMQWQAATEMARTAAQLALSLRQLDPMLRLEGGERPKQEQGEPLYYASLQGKRPAAAAVAVEDGAGVAATAQPSPAGGFEYLLHIRPPPTPTAAQQMALATMVAEQQKALRQQERQQQAAAAQAAAQPDAAEQPAAGQEAGQPGGAEGAAAAASAPASEDVKPEPPAEQQAVPEAEPMQTDAPQEQQPAQEVKEEQPPAAEPAAAVPNGLPEAPQLPPAAVAAEAAPAAEAAAPAPQPAPAALEPAAAAAPELDMAEPAAEPAAAAPAPEAAAPAEAEAPAAMDVDAAQAPLATAAEALRAGSSQLPQASSQLELGSLVTSEVAELPSEAPPASLAATAPSESQEQALSGEEGPSGLLQPGESEQEQGPERKRPRSLEWRLQEEEGPTEAPSAAVAAKMRRLEAGAPACSACCVACSFLGEMMLCAWMGSAVSVMFFMPSAAGRPVA